MPIDAPFVLTPPAASGLEGLVLNGLNLNSGPGGGVYSLEALDMTPPPKLPEWAKGADSDGQALVRTPLYDNRTITAQIRIENVGTMDLALTALGVLVDQVQEAEKQPNGSPLVWTPANGTRTLTAYVLTGMVTGVPISVEQAAGWFVHRPFVTITLTCRPFLYGAEIVGSPVTSTDPVLTLTAASVPGDVPAEARLIVTDSAGQSRRFVEWGLEQRYYNASTALLIDSEDLVTTGFSGAQVVAAGCYRRPGATHDLVLSTIFPSPTAVCGTGTLSHVGTFRVKAHVQVGAGQPQAQARFVYQDGDGPFRGNQWVTPPITNFNCEVDFGVITLSPAKAGAQKWSGYFEAMSPVLGDFLAIDYVVLVPVAEGYGKARAPLSSSAGAIVASDVLQGVALTTVLNGTTAQAGGNWATSGSTGDFAYIPVYVPSSYATQIGRSTTGDASPRFGILGAARTDIYVAASVAFNGPGGSSGVIARWIDANNYAVAIFSTTAVTFKITVAGSVVFSQLAPSASRSMQIALAVQPSGSWTVAANSATLMSGTHASLATGGALASGKGGLYDMNPGSALTRYYYNFAINGLPSESIAMYASQSLEVRSDCTIRKDSTGTYYGPVPLYRGSRMFVPQAGGANRTSRILVKADRNDIEAVGSATAPLGDSLTAQLAITPRFHVVPR